MIWRRCGPDVEAAFLSDLAEGSYGQISQVEPGDLRRMSELVATYTNLPLGGADACLVAMAERLKIADIATMDRRHFSIVRPNHVDAFTLLP